MPDPKKPQAKTAESLEKANKQFKDSLAILKQQESDSLSHWEEPLIIEDPDNDPESELAKRQFLLYRPILKVKTEDDENENEKPLETLYIISIEKDGKMIAYSIGTSGFSDEFHDISHLNMSFNDFKNKLDTTIRKGDSAVDIAKSFKEQFPGRNTYIDKATQASATETLQNKLKNKSDEKDAGKSAPTPFNTTPKPW